MTDSPKHAPTRIEFVLAGSSESGKTQLWEATLPSGVILGVVSWFGQWRRYTFWPHQETTYDHLCLREIADYCERKTKAHTTAREALKNAGEK